MDNTASRAKCYAGASLLQRRVRPHRCGVLLGGQTRSPSETEEPAAREVKCKVDGWREFLLLQSSPEQKACTREEDKNGYVVDERNGLRQRASQQPASDHVPNEESSEERECVE